MGFDFWGFELDKDYYEAQEKRFKEQTAQLKMFAA
jgi:site-specific DNA-methyltransferase (adenine-specific)